MKQHRRSRVFAAKVGASALSVAALMSLQGVATASAAPLKASAPTAQTPIQHVVVIFGENVSFDHYFATYPNATNTSGQTFTAKSGTPEVNGLTDDAANGNQPLLTNNPNGVNPVRLDPSNVNDVLTCDQNHNYTPEQNAFDNGAMDKFLSNVATGTGLDPAGQPCNADQDLDYYDGNTVTALWNYAQNFSLSDNSFGTTFGPSTPGALNVVSGDTGNVIPSKILPSPATNTAVVSDGQGAYSDIGDTTPYYDDCPDATTAIALSGQNVGDQLNSAGLSWGWFQGGFAPTTASSVTGADPNYVSPDGTYESGDTPAACGATHNVGVALGGTGKTGTAAYGTKSDYIAHHDPFQYYASTANPHHLVPNTTTVAGLESIGTDTQSYVNGVPQFNTPNHQYDISTFNELLAAIDNGQVPASQLPAVSYLKAPGYEDGHADYSDPLDEQQFITTEINDLEQSPDWSSTAVILAYDDSDGFYDHVDAETENGGQPQNASHTASDTLNGATDCGSTSDAPTLTNSSGQAEQGRCGFGPRLPLLVVSPYAKSNYVSNALSDQSSIVTFIEDNWQLGGIAGSAASSTTNADDPLLDMFDFSQTPTPPLYLNSVTGQPEAAPALPPAPQLPESSFPGALIATGGAVLGGAALLEARRRRRKAKLATR